MNRARKILLASGIIVFALVLYLDHWQSNHNFYDYSVVVKPIFADLKIAGILFVFFLGALSWLAKYEKIWKKLRVVLLNLALASGSIVFLLAIIETALYYKYRYVWIGAVNSPVHRTFPQKFYKRNTGGFRDIERSDKKPPGTFRIMALGDSFTFGEGIKYPGERYSDLLEKKLNSRGASVKYEVLNCGGQGWNTEKQLEFLNERGFACQPDLIVLAYVLNDAKTMAIIKDYLKKRELKSPAKLGSGHLLPYPYGMFLAGYSFTYYILEKRLMRLSFFNKTDQRKGHTYIDQYYAPQKWETYRGILTDFIKRVKGKTRLMIMVFPMFVRFNDYPYGYIHELVKGVALRNSVPVLDLLPAYKGMDDKTLTVSAYDNHPNEAVHKVAAEKLYRKLITDKLIPSFE